MESVLYFTVVGILTLAENIILAFAVIAIITHFARA